MIDCGTILSVIGGAGTYKLCVRTKSCGRLAACLRPDPTPSLDISVNIHHLWLPQYISFYLTMACYPFNCYFSVMGLELSSSVMNLSF